MPVDKVKLDKLLELKTTLEKTEAEINDILGERPKRAYTKRTDAQPWEHPANADGTS